MKRTGLYPSLVQELGDLSASQVIQLFLQLQKVGRHLCGVVALCSVPSVRARATVLA